MQQSLHDPTLSPAEIRELVDLGHDVNGRNEEGETPLHVHVWGDVENVKALIEAGADVNLRKLSSPWGNDMTALHAAVDAEEPEAVKAVPHTSSSIDELIRNGIDVNGSMGIASLARTRQVVTVLSTSR